MDPTQTLTDIREITGEIAMTGDPTELARHAERLATLVEALDDWLSKGGFLPDAWSNERTGRA